jgi:hypothetical protein
LNIGLPFLEQVCDDSTKKGVKQRIDAKVAEMQEQGHHCLVTRRDINVGFKAGNLMNGMDRLTEVRPTGGCSSAH